MIARQLERRDKPIKKAGAFSLAGGREMGRFSGPACGDIFLKQLLDIRNGRERSMFAADPLRNHVGCSKRCPVDKAKNPRSEKPSLLIDKSSIRY
ncbi:MAG: hypothetical protein KK482_29600 [Sinorhizobium meliloti]|nr:hypothetical protein [Sinorhizobium meliloti]